MIERLQESIDNGDWKHLKIEIISEQRPIPPIGVDSKGIHLGSISDMNGVLGLNPPAHEEWAHMILRALDLWWALQFCKGLDEAHTLEHEGLAKVLKEASHT